MLVAKTANDQLISLTSDITKSQLLQLRKSMTFYCPQCQETLQLKVGQVKIPHFAHIKNTFCEHAFSERESVEHLKGKQQLFQLFQRLGIHAELESYIPSLQQRPDILLTVENRQYAIEFQCSRIPYEQMMERTAGYVSKNIIPIWIPKSHQKQTLHTTTKITLNDFDRFFLSTYKNRQYLISFDPHSSQFIYINHVMHIMKNTYIATLCPLSMHQQVFPFYVPNQIDFALFEKQMAIYFKYRESFLRRRLFFSQHGVQDLFLRSIYELRLVREQLPSFIGIPVKHSDYLPVYTAEWQTLLFYFSHLHQVAVSELDEKGVQYFFKWASLPMSPEAFVAVTQYVEIVKILKIEQPHTTVSMSNLFTTLYGQLVAIG